MRLGIQSALNGCSRPEPDSTLVPLSVWRFAPAPDSRGGSQVSSGARWQSCTQARGLCKERAGGFQLPPAPSLKLGLPRYCLSGSAILAHQSWTVVWAASPSSVAAVPGTGDPADLTWPAGSLGTHGQGERGLRDWGQHGGVHGA